MAILKFPPLETADEFGLLAIGGDMEISSLKLAYSQGIFPWPISEKYPLAWFSPDPRGIIELSELHLSESLKKAIKKTQFQIHFNRDFHSVILNCAKAKRKDGAGTWINDKIIEAFIDFFYAGHAYSVEAYDGDELVGGLYGVSIGQFFCGESMFFHQPNASKIALSCWLLRLKSFGITFLDTQMVTSVVEQLGGKLIPRTLYIEKLTEAIKNPLTNFNKEKIFSPIIKPADLLRTRTILT